MSDFVAPIRLVAGREIRERTRTRSFRVALLLSVIVAGVAVVLPKVLSGSGTPVHIGAVGDLTNQTTDLATVRAAVGRPVVLDQLATPALAYAEVRNGQLAAAVVDGEIVVLHKPATTDTSTTARATEALAATLGLLATEAKLGLTAPQIALLNLSAPLPVVGLAPAQRTRTRQRTITFIGVLMIEIFMSIFGMWIMYGVVEEKQSRVVEILLATVRPTQLLAGKIVGVGTLALLEGVAVAGTALVAAAVSGSDVLRGAGTGLVLALVGWFLLAYAFYSSIQAAAGSLVGRSEEIQNVVFPIQMPLLIAYIAAISVTSSGSVSVFVKILSFLPPTAPIAMPVRMAAESTPWWQILLSVALMIAGIVVIVRFAARVYGGAVLRTGRRLRWREALESPGV